MMVLLKNMMDEIRADTSGYNTELWHYRVSGNILELTVQLSSRRDRKGYRTAVISAGQAIRTLTSRLEELGHYTLIQSFPSLEHPELVASVRLYDRSEEHTSELQSRGHLVCRLLLEKKKHPHDHRPP